MDLQVNLPDVSATLDDITIKLYKYQNSSSVLLKTHTHKFNESVSSGKVWVGTRDIYGDNTSGSIGNFTNANTRALRSYTNFVAEVIPFPDGNNQTTAFFSVRLPYYDTNNSASDNTFKIHWIGESTRSGLTGYDVYWELGAFNLTDDKGFNGNYTNVAGNSFDTNNTNSTYDLNVDPINVAVASGASPQMFYISRYSSSGDDTMNADANLIGIEIDYKPVMAHKHDETIYVKHMVDETGNASDWSYYYTIEATNTDPLITTTDIGAVGYHAYDLSILQIYNS